ncbi:hypothetical protein [Lacipirellula sp.]|uniref:hypothetical protein n=1 Tax=Lacipirellula sp. TaxID=2691419 RepID=UPI003D1454CC
MGTFRFDGNKSVDDNLDSFFEHLKGVNAEFSAILREEIGTMIPLPEGQRRTTARTAFSTAVARKLDGEKGSAAEAKS